MCKNPSMYEHIFYWFLKIICRFTAELLWCNVLSSRQLMWNSTLAAWWCNTLATIYIFRIKWSDLCSLPTGKWFRLTLVSRFFLQFVSSATRPNLRFSSPSPAEIFLLSNSRQVSFVGVDVWVYPNFIDFISHLWEHTSQSAATRQSAAEPFSPFFFFWQAVWNREFARGNTFQTHVPSYLQIFQIRARMQVW